MLKYLIRIEVFVHYKAFVERVESKDRCVDNLKLKTKQFDVSNNMENLVNSELERK